MPPIDAKDVSNAYRKFETLLSSQKARTYLKNAEAMLAYDIELYLQPTRDILADCFTILGDMIRERGTESTPIQNSVPDIKRYLDPCMKTSEEITILEKELNEKKRKHPDINMAVKLQVLIKTYETERTKIGEYTPKYIAITKKLDQLKKTLQDHLQTKVRLAQKAFAPETLELAMHQLKLAQLHEHLLELKRNLLEGVRDHTKRTMLGLVKVFEGAEPELADAILMQTSALNNTGSLPESEKKYKQPTTLKEFRGALNEQNQRIEAFDNHLTECQEQLKQVKEMQETIFSMYGEKLRERGIKFKKPKQHITSSSTGEIKKQKAARMITRG